LKGRRRIKQLLNPATNEYIDQKVKKGSSDRKGSSKKEGSETPINEVKIVA